MGRNEGGIVREGDEKERREVSPLSISGCTSQARQSEKRKFGRSKKAGLVWRVNLGELDKDCMRMDTLPPATAARVSSWI
jgi:hypothetical protein